MTDDDVAEARRIAERFDHRPKTIFDPSPWDPKPGSLASLWRNTALSWRRDLRDLRLLPLRLMLRGSRRFIPPELPNRDVLADALEGADLLIGRSVGQERLAYRRRLAADLVALGVDADYVASRLGDPDAPAPSRKKTREGNGR